MNNGVLLFFGVLFAMISSWFSFVHSPQLQLGNQIPEQDETTGKIFPLPRTGAANRGLDVYRRNGCVSCHTQQVRQKNYQFSLVADDWGPNTAQIGKALSSLADGRFQEGTPLPSTPFTIQDGLPLVEANRIAGSWLDKGASVRRVNHPVDADIRRGWGFRRTVARDYLLDQTTMLGSQRIGPDLSNIGNRRPDSNWHLLHLFQPRKFVKNSIMPSYRYLFETRDLRGAGGDANALRHEGKLVTDVQGRQIIPKPEARDLAAYLVSLRLDQTVFEAPGLLTQPDEADKINSQSIKNQAEQTK